MHYYRTISPLPQTARFWCTPDNRHKSFWLAAFFKAIDRDCLLWNNSLLKQHILARICVYNCIYVHICIYILGCNTISRARKFSVNKLILLCTINKKFLYDVHIYVNNRNSKWTEVVCNVSMGKKRSNGSPRPLPPFCRSLGVHIQGTFSLKSSFIYIVRGRLFQVVLLLRLSAVCMNASHSKVCSKESKWCFFQYCR